ncbi:PilZ domain-containing protein [Geobacter benzoatilyticus]|uniref:PilZ domain-containing protein n=1 Tax=Geobacter benzoatilyticus TaxID=2815309 RepID=A0ABX7Q7L2_9BACT|nr:PilZ domain-containing protein [Geobacter benzoatilyticus]QSV47033.1 PilZ domain-containing protein [Geobacter benzoatilyticus]
MGQFERRHFPRVPFSAPAFLQKDSIITFGEVRDISLHGLYLSVRGDHKPDEDALVSIYFLNGTSTLTITMPGRIVRTGTDGIGFASPHLDPLQLLSYESVLSFGYESPQLMEEFLSHAGTLAPGKEGIVT